MKRTARRDSFIRFAIRSFADGRAPASAPLDSYPEFPLYFIRRILYYFRSLFTLLAGVRNPDALVALARGRGPVLLILRDGSRYHVRTLMDAWIVKETALDREYERHGAALQDGWTILDIGAASGDFTVFAARRAPGGRVIAFEPAPDSVEMLRQNVAENGLRNVEIRPAAVGAQAGEVTLDVSGGVAVQYRTAGVKEIGPGRFAAPCAALSDVLAGLPGCVDFLKIDVEGAEYETLFSLDDASLGRVRRVCLEYHKGVTQYGPADLERFFRSKGWTVRVSPSPVRPELGILYAQAPTSQETFTTKTQRHEAAQRALSETSSLCVLVVKAYSVSACKC